MRKMKYIIPILLFFIAIGYAAISASLSIEGNALIVSDYDDYKVYFSRVLVNGEEKDNVVDSETKLVFDVRLVEPGDEYILTYDVTNGSKYFDASVTMSCSGGDVNIGIDNQFDNSNLPALSSRTGILTVKKLKSNSTQENIVYSITCNLLAESVDRTNPGSGEVAGPVKRKIVKLVSGDGTNIGDELDVGGEHFYVVSNNGTEAVLLAKYNLEVGSNCINVTGVTYSCTEIVESSGIQSNKALGYTSTGNNTTGNYGVVQFSSSRYWAMFDESDTLVIPSEYENGFIYDSNTYFKTYIDNYESYLESFGLSIIESRIMNVGELVSLGCSSPTVSSGSGTCSSSVYSWVYSTSYWTNGYVGTSGYVKSVSSDGTYTSSYYSDINRYGVRPVIVISADTILT